MPMRKKVEGRSCRCAVRDVLDRIADRWSLLVLLRLERGSLRFSELKRVIGDISQRMLSQTLRRLEEEGLVAREVFSTAPPRVDYRLTELGSSLLVPVYHLVDWADSNHDRVRAARAAFRRRRAGSAGAASDPDDTPLVDNSDPVARGREEPAAGMGRPA